MLRRSATERTVDSARAVLERVRSFEHSSEEFAHRVLQWKPLRHWSSVGCTVLFLAWLESLGCGEFLRIWYRDVASLHFELWLHALVEFMVKSGLRLVLGSAASFGTVELIWGYLLGSGSRISFPGRLAHIPVNEHRDQKILSGLLLVVTVLWYLVFFPPSGWGFCYGVWRAICVVSSGLFLCASLFEENGWKYVPLSALCLFLSGSRSCQVLLAVDGLAAASHCFTYCRRLYFLHEAKRDFHLRVRRVMKLETFHPVFVEETFERIVHTHVRTPMARRMAFAVHRCLSFGTQKRLLKQNVEELKRSLNALHGCSASGDNHDDVQVIEIHRDRLLETTFDAVKEAGLSSLIGNLLQVVFVGEMGVDEGGLLRDWFDSIGARLTAEATDPESSCPLVAQPGEQSLVLRPNTERYEDFYALGRLLALAIQRGVHIPINFSRASWKLLCGISLDAHDAFALDPEFFKHRVAAVLEPNGVQSVGTIVGEPLRFESAECAFCPEAVELLPGGRDRLVTEEDKIEYVQLLCEFYICGRVRREWQLLGQGFEDLLPRRLLRDNNIDDRDVELLVAGLPEVNVEEWREHTVLDGPLVGKGEADVVVTWFWSIVAHFGDERRAKLLQFATGSSRLPPSGFSGLEPPFCIYLVDGPPERLPTASTCANQLTLLPYPSKYVLIDRMRTICDESSAGFGFM